MKMSAGNTQKGEVVIRKANNVFDIFFGGDGWENWSRFKLKGTSLEYIKGIKLPHPIYKYVLSTILGHK